MSYSLDLRHRVIDFVNGVGSKSDAAKIFSVSAWCVYQWCKRKNLAPHPSPGRPRGKLDWYSLK